MQRTGRSMPVVHLLWEQADRVRFSAARWFSSDDLGQIVDSCHAVPAAEPDEASIHLPLPFPFFLKDIPLARSRDLPHLGLMEVERRVIHVFSFILCQRKFFSEHRLYLNEMQGIFALRDDVQLAGFPYEVTIENIEAVSSQIFASDIFSERAHLLTGIRRDIHAF